MGRANCLAITTGWLGRVWYFSFDTEQHAQEWKLAIQDVKKASAANDWVCQGKTGDGCFQGTVDGSGSRIAKILTTVSSARSQRAAACSLTQPPPAKCCWTATT